MDAARAAMWSRGWSTMHRILPEITVVALDEAPEVRLMGHIEGAPELAADMAMEVWFQTLPNGPTLPQ
jgi:hypothetical protein